jgi:TatD DNase family protein
MWIDTHCHLDADEFDGDRADVVDRARAAAVSMLVMPAGHVDDHEKAATVAREFGFAYALGIHPLWLDRADEADVDRLREIVPAALADPRFVAIGEIGIDLAEPRSDIDRQQWFYREQLRVARDFAAGHFTCGNSSIADEAPAPHRRHSGSSMVQRRRNRRTVHERLQAGFGGARHIIPAHPAPRRTRRRCLSSRPTRCTLPRRLGDTRNNEPGELPRIASELAVARRAARRSAQRNRINAIRRCCDSARGSPQCRPSHHT